MPSIAPDLAGVLVEAKRRVETIARQDGTLLYELRYGGGPLR